MGYIFTPITEYDYDGATLKLDILSQEGNPTPEMVMLLFEDQWPQYYQDIDLAYFSGLVVRVQHGLYYWYFKLDEYVEPPVEIEIPKTHINEIDIFRLILSEFNNNSSNGKLKFSIGYYFLDEEGQMGGFSRRFTQENGRFDVKETIDDDTYELKDKSFVPMSVPMLNSNYLAHDKIKEITYEPMIDFLVYAEDIISFRGIELVLQEIRARLIQYQTILEVTNIKTNVDDEEIKEYYKVVMMSGELMYGEIVRVAGKAYLSMSMPLTIEVSNHGEYANQEKVYLSVPSVKDGNNNPLEIEVDMLSWNWGVGIDTEPSQVLTSHNVLDIKKADMIRAVPKATAFSFSMAVYIDFDNPILRKIYIDSRKPKPETSTEKWTLKSVVTRFDKTLGEYVEDNELGFQDKFYLDTKVLNEEISKGEKLIFALNFTPAWDYDK